MLLLSTIFSLFFRSNNPNNSSCLNCEWGRRVCSNPVRVNQVRATDELGSAIYDGCRPTDRPTKTAGPNDVDASAAPLVSHSAQKERERENIGSHVDDQTRKSLFYLFPQRRMRAHKRVWLGATFWSPFPTCSEPSVVTIFQLKKRKQKETKPKFDVTACVLVLISPLNHVRCTRDLRYEKKTIPVLPNPPSFRPHDHFVTINDYFSFAMTVCQSFIYLGRTLHVTDTVVRPFV